MRKVVIVGVICPMKLLKLSLVESGGALYAVQGGKVIHLVYFAVDNTITPYHSRIRAEVIELACCEGFAKVCGVAQEPVKAMASLKRAVYE